MKPVIFRNQQALMDWMVLLCRRAEADGWLWRKGLKFAELLWPFGK